LSKRGAEMKKGVSKKLIFCITLAVMAGLFLFSEEALAWETIK